MSGIADRPTPTHYQEDGWLHVEWLGNRPVWISSEARDSWTILNYSLTQNSWPTFKSESKRVAVKTLCIFGSFKVILSWIYNKMYTFLTILLFYYFLKTDEKNLCFLPNTTVVGNHHRSYSISIPELVGYSLKIINTLDSEHAQSGHNQSTWCSYKTLNRLFLSEYAIYCHIYIQVLLISLLFLTLHLHFCYLWEEFNIRMNYVCLWKKIGIGIFYQREFHSNTCLSGRY